MLSQKLIDSNPDRKRYMFVDCQANLKARDEHYSFPRKSWFPFKGIAWLCVIGAMAYVALYLGFFDFLVR